MAPNRTQAAVSAMKKLGISVEKTKHVLKMILPLYGGKWALIEAENYRALADSIFDLDTEEGAQDTSIPEEPVACPVGNVLEQDEPEPERPSNGKRILDQGSLNLILDQVGNVSSFNEHTGLPSSAGEEQNNLAVTVVPDKSLVDGEIATSSLGEKESNGVLDTNLQSLVAFEQHNSDGTKFIRDSDDITRGEERVKISLVNESERESIPSFHYISRIGANVKISFSQIGAEDYCQNCNDNCLSSAKETACLCAKGGGFAYTSEGLLKEEFLEECMSVVQNPAKHDIGFCSTCPLEKCKNEGMLEHCKGHFKRKFIKECWTKCGCSKFCANRVVQWGITRKLQIFWTPEGKGWGLRTLEELPKGVFICEFVGEVLTISELQQRSVKRKGNEKHSYAVVLDFGWGCGDLQDNQSLCLDGTFYGNAARFINHRCLDANLIEVPVQVETSDRHYYHIALFTTRKIEAMEELTWDYGIDFDSKGHHFKSFPCLCGSEVCRNMKRTNSKVV